MAALEGAGLAIGLHRGDDFFGHLLQVSHFVETHDIPDLEHPLVLALLLAKEVGYGRRTRH